jgi:dGTPase
MNDFGQSLLPSLAHDIGNPPFGHSGEKRLGNISLSETEKYKDQLTAKSGKIDFEGNANGFTVLTGSRPGIEGGLRISLLLWEHLKYQRKVYRRNQQPISQIKVWLFKLIRYSLKK